jgi:hypothetical protein
MWRFVCDSLGKFNDVIVLRNKFVLPLGYTHDKYIKESLFNTLSMSQKDFVSLDACVVKDADAAKCAGLQEFQLKDTFAANMFNPDVYTQKIAALRRDTLTVGQFGQTAITGKINLASTKIVYLSIPYDAGWTAKVDGKEQEKLKINAGLTGLLLPQGAHTIEMNYELRYFKKGVYMSLFGLLAFGGLFFVFKKKNLPEA